MNNVVRRTAKKFIKSIKGQLDFATVEEYVNTLGYKVIFFNTERGNIEINRYSLAEKAESKKAFTYNGTAKIIFIDNNLSGEDKTYLLYHELAHIELKHLASVRLSIKSSILLDIEADAFVHEILNPKKFNIFMPLLFVMFGVSCFTLGAYSGFISDISAPHSEYVYITATGTKFHTNSCIHVQENKSIKIEKSECEKLFAPCKVCNP